MGKNKGAGRHGTNEAEGAGRQGMYKASGQATELDLNEYRDRKITKNTFLDDSFRKNQESALRFGNTLLVQGVDNDDPILNPGLNMELRKTGGRDLIVTDQDSGDTESGQGTNEAEGAGRQGRYKAEGAGRQGMYKGAGCQGTNEAEGAG